MNLESIKAGLELCLDKTEDTPKLIGKKFKAFVYSIEVLEGADFKAEAITKPDSRLSFDLKENKWSGSVGIELTLTFKWGDQSIIKTFDYDLDIGDDLQMIDDIIVEFIEHLLKM